MKQSNIEQKLLVSRPDEIAPLDGAFTNRVMTDIARTEILSSAVRRMKVNTKETCFMKLHHLPKFAAVILAIITLLAVSGTAYAMYTLLWQHPKVTTQTPTTNQFGRIQTIASFTDCQDQQTQATFEIKQGSTLEPSEISKVLQARCEMTAIRAWTGESKTPDGSFRPPEPGVAIKEEISSSSVASKISAINNTSVSLIGDEWNSPKESLAITPDTKYIANNAEATANEFHVDDAVIYVQKHTMKYTTIKTDTGSSSTGEAVKSTLTYLIKVGLPFEYYGPGKQNQLAERTPCLGNEQDSCVQAARIDLFGPLAGRPTPSVTAIRDIQGIITKHEGTSLTIKSSSGRLFTMTTSSDVIREFNETRSGVYNNVTVDVGDMLSIQYLEDIHSHAIILNPSQINHIALTLTMIQKSDPLKKY